MDSHTEIQDASAAAAATASSSAAAISSVAAACPVSAPMAPPNLAYQYLTVERILRQRRMTPASELQFRVKFKSLHTEIWVTREQLFFTQDGVDTLRQLEEFEAWAEAHPDQALLDRPREKDLLPDEEVGEEEELIDASALEMAAEELKALQRKNNVTQITKKQLASVHKRKSNPGTEKKKSAPKKRARRSQESASPSLQSEQENEEEAESQASDSSDSAALAAQGIYEVERLLGDVWDNGVHWYRVQWKGFSDHDNSWQRPEDLDGCSAQLKEYWKQKRTKRKVWEERKRLARTKARRERHAQHADMVSKEKQPQMIEAPVPLLNNEPTGPSTATAAAANATPMEIDANDAVPPSSTTHLPAADVHPGTPSSTPTPAAAPPSTNLSLHNAEPEFQIQSFPTLQAALHAAEKETASQAVAATTSLSDYEDQPPVVFSDSDSSHSSSRSTSSTTSLLMHPQHAHARDTPQCVLAHDWYEVENDECLWLVLVKWKHKPVSDSSWEPIDSIFFSAAPQKKVLTTYLKGLDAKTRKALEKNVAL